MNKLNRITFFGVASSILIFLALATCSITFSLSSTNYSSNWDVKFTNIDGSYNYNIAGTTAILDVGLKDGVGKVGIEISNNSRNDVVLNDYQIKFQDASLNEYFDYSMYINNVEYYRGDILTRNTKQELLIVFKLKEDNVPDNLYNKLKNQIISVDVLFDYQTE